MNKITGTLIWYYYVCKREVWLMSRELNPFQEDEFLEMGRLIHENAYVREKKEIETAHMKVDLLRKEGECFVVGEIKKSSRFLLPSKMQLIFYLYRLKKQGVKMKGELLIPKERKRIPVELTEELEKVLLEDMKHIREIISQDVPPEAKKIRFCRNCAYNDFCWA
ncbi:CRISPR-associated protein Cas4 [Candidatus Calescamantes bacterium]|nr:CRISPR-associated protein Cas4 [Candidatus Calescamantes bacterium]